MPEPALPTPASYEPAEKIFDVPGRAFHPITELLGITVLPDALELRLGTRGGLVLAGRLSFSAPSVARLQWRFGAPPDAHVTEMLLAPAPRLPLSVRETAEAVYVQAGGPEVRLDRRPWRMAFGGYATEPADTSLVAAICEPGGWAHEPAGVRAYETFSLAPGEALCGLGERFCGPSLRGRRLVHWIDEPFGANTTDLVYKSVPLVVSSRGYGLFFHHPERATFDLGARSNAAATVYVESAELDLFVLLGSPKEILRDYTALTGRAGVPPEWSFGVWMSKCMYANRAEVAEVLATARSHGVDVAVVGLDPLWLEGRAGRAADFCDFRWDTAAFGPPAEFAAWLHAQGVRLCLWVNPYVAEDRGFVPDRLVSGGRVRDAAFPERAFVDFTGAGATWWQAEMAALLAAGVDAFKLDYGEVLPVAGRMADGRTGAEVHNLYPLLASRTAFAAGAPLCYTRAGTAGSQRYPLHWSGDAQSSWAGLAGALRGGLAAAWSGFAHWTTDIGGFFVRDIHPDPDDASFGFSNPDPELYIRWLQLGHLLSHTRYHGIGGREPWAYGEAALRAARDFGALRRRLRAYLLACAEEAERTGCPVLRPLALEVPEDPTCWTVDTGYFLGPDLLVYPVLAPDGEVAVYLPAGDWVDHFSGARHSGPGWLREQFGTDRLGLYVRAGADPWGSGQNVR